MPAPARAEFPNCREIQTLASDAASGFVGLIGQQLRAETLADMARLNGLKADELPAGMSYSNEVHAARRTLSGAAECVVSIGGITDRDTVTEWRRYECSWAPIRRDSEAEARWLAVLDLLEGCIPNPQHSESDDGSIGMVIAIEESALGYDAVELSARNEPDGDQGARVLLNVQRIECKARRERACD